MYDSLPDQQLKKSSSRSPSFVLGMLLGSSHEQRTGCAEAKGQPVAPAFDVLSFIITLMCLSGSTCSCGCVMLRVSAGIAPALKWHAWRSAARGSLDSALGQAGVPLPDAKTGLGPLCTKPDTSTTPAHCSP